MQTPHNEISISSGTLVRAILLLGLVWLLFYMRELILVIFTAVVLASAVEPMVEFFARFKVARVPAVTIVYLVVAIGLASIFYFLLPPLLHETLGFLQQLPETIRTFDFSSLKNSTSILSQNFNLSDVGGAREGALSGVQNAVSTVSGGLYETTSAVFGGIVSFILIVVLSFYFAVQETGVDDFLRLIAPVKSQDYVLNLWKRAQVKIGLWMQGQILLGLIIGVFSYLGLLLAGVPYALLLAIIAAMFELIPVFGPVLAAIPAVIIGFTDGGTSLGLYVLGLYVIIHQFENHLLYPLVVRKVVGVPPVMVIISLIAGGMLAGVLGVILSVPVAAGLKEYIDDIQRKKESQRRALASN